MTASTNENIRKKGFAYYKLIMLGVILFLAAGLGTYYYYGYC